MTQSQLENIIKTIKSPSKATRSINGKNYQISYIDASELKTHSISLFGFVHKGRIYIVKGLSPNVDRAVFRHEVYHTEDSRKWLGRYGMELRANMHTALHDPIGFIATLTKSITISRLRTYWQLYIYPH